MWQKLNGFDIDDPYAVTCHKAAGHPGEFRQTDGCMSNNTENVRTLRRRGHWDGEDAENVRTLRLWEHWEREDAENGRTQRTWEEGEGEEREEEKKENELFNTIISLFFNTLWRISRLTIIIILWPFYSLYPRGQAYITALPLFICSSETCMFLKYMTRRYKIKHVFVLYKFSA